MTKLLERIMDFIESFEEEGSLGWIGWDEDCKREGDRERLWKERSLDSSLGFNNGIRIGLGEGDGQGFGVGTSERTGDEVEQPI